VSDEYYGGYFNSVVKDAISELKKKGSAVVFYKEQVEAVLKVVKAEVKEVDGIFYLRRVYGKEKWSL